uniref:Uncharacterized protein n=1 Tax=Aplanochytrium stocchinoi TaxID=215587 RepID=A0A7S3PQP9_9STRA|mmetsp:Transcript_4295/g.5039  ORF Transcript_4295/g.5039 Transcript_4295/m.5039 type:complete len:320 (+) Transcript_4295:197-1156(+)|eukprot:CAMPEP_0204828186 /NCGR_PEP_ID=MMETSP1346-20131115/5837_1 /ASSEMBLY_ACC=CAM_ASM_000771 /TAXON_ID=215587 /ORGANISM="Aplanochytrium stocchinoi, Strain GSBS06" /LENGTH=319 /DNA_ID=CAMNT_0051957063 /DNA_START=130 /DNA_END=1089 /DNA_ORIENTATION=+
MSSIRIALRSFAEPYMRSCSGFHKGKGFNALGMAEKNNKPTRFANGSWFRSFGTGSVDDTQISSKAPTSKENTEENAKVEGKGASELEPIYTCKYTNENFYNQNDVMRYQDTLRVEKNGDEVIQIPVYTKPLVHPKTPENKKWLETRDQHASRFGLTPIAFSKHIYNLQKGNPDAWTDYALSEKYHLPIEKISAIIRMREHAENWEKKYPVEPEIDLDVLAREVFGELDMKLLHEEHMEFMRRPPEGDSGYFMALGENEPDLEVQRKKWKEKGMLSTNNPYNKYPDIDEKAVSIGLSDRLKEKEKEKAKAAKEFTVTEI